MYSSVFRFEGNIGGFNFSKLLLFKYFARSSGADISGSVLIIFSVLRLFASLSLSLSLSPSSNVCVCVCVCVCNGD